jgi:dihydrofolate synthase / folylpolyglutamate synthase
VGVLAVMRDKDVRGLLEAFEPVLAEVVVTRNSTDRSMPAQELAELAAEVFGADRVSTEARLDDAVDRAIALAEAGVQDASLGGTGVLITGSVVTAGEAGRLLRR